MQWFRAYQEARNDAKLKSLQDDEFRVWFNLLCYAADQEEERGAFDASDRFLIALECSGGDEELLSRAVTRLSRLRIIEDNGDVIRFINFERRQYDKPSDAPSQTRERKRKQRATTRDSGGNNGESRDVTPGHAEIREEENREEQSRAEGEEANARAREASEPIKPVEPIKPPETPPKPPDPFEYVMAMCEATGTDVSELTPSVKGKQCKAAERLRADGVSPEDAARCIRWLRSQSWRTGGVDLFTVEKEYGGWVLAGRPDRAEFKQANGRASPGRQSNYDISAANIDAAFGNDDGGFDGPVYDTTARLVS